ncbi:transposase [Sporomusaceae bacterium FL31]|nr:transposase [Sporomusaceae bacterium FL31]GCE35048.1 transposase [Sporomusaceae bacterium]
MQNVLVVNSLIEQLEADAKRIYRIVWIDEGNIVAYLMDMSKDNNGFPELKRINDLKWDIYMEKSKLMSTDPYIKVLDDDEISSDAKKRRDKNYEIIANLVKSIPDIFDRNKRGKLVKEAAVIHGTSINTINSLLRRYWRRGQNIDAVAPDYDARGGKNKPKSSGTKKRGRPSILNSGINVDDVVENQFRIVYKKYFLEGYSLTATYGMLLRDFYSKDVRYDEKGKHWVILDDIGNCPTRAQFVWWRKKNQDYELEIRKRKGNKAYETKYRPLLGSSTVGSDGPGSRFQIDATVGDVYLISKFNRNWIIGRPVIYIVIDVFSRMIVGYYVGLEGPSWLGAIMALVNVSESKAKYCEAYSEYSSRLKISEDDWPCHYLPSKLVSDRGEIAGKMIQPYLEKMEIKNEIAAPYRPDWKGIVENHFNLLNQKIKPIVPGTFDRNLLDSRIGPEYRLDAKLTIDEFRAIVLLCILHHNNRRIDAYPLDEEMVSDNVQPIPVDLWRWGMKNRGGSLKSYPQDIVKLTLLPKDTANITNKGIIFKNIRYTCDRAIKENWYAKPAATKKAQKIKICYDPRNLNYIYIPREDYRGFDVCRQIEHQSQYKDKSIEDLIYWQEQQRLNKAQGARKQFQETIDLHTGINQIVDQALKVSVSPNEASKAERLRNIRINRKAEKEIIRHEEAFNLSGDKIIAPELNNVMTYGDEDEDHDQIEFFARKQKELKDARR